MSVFLNISDMISSMLDDLSKDELIFFAGEMSKSARNLINLLENLLTWSRSQTGRLSFNPENCDLHTLSTSSATLLQLSANKKTISVNKI